MIKYLSSSSQKTKKLGERLAKAIIKENKKSANLRVVALKGELGGGKTTFLQGFAKGLAIKKSILSPTFVIIKKFKVDKKTIKFFYHLDCYRIKKPVEILKLGFREIISDSKNIIAIEWSENITHILPSNIISIRFQFINEKERMISIKVPSLFKDIYSELK